jgi:ELWxxDGT repeat protein
MKRHDYSRVVSPRYQRLQFELLEERHLLAAMPRLVKDINTTSAAVSSEPREITEVGGLVFFTAITPTTGRELWKSDGTEAGTVRVKDIHPGIGGSYPGSLTNVNGTLYFSATDAQNGREVWKSDGTELGTVRVKDIWPGSGAGDPGSLTNVNGTLYFRANDGIAGAELWTSDGTEAGTVMVIDLVTGSGGSNPEWMTVVGDQLFFAATDDVHGRELWAIDLSTPGDDRNQDGLIDVQDLDAICAAVSGGTATRDEIEGFWSRQNTGPGDANFDHLFNSSDLVSVFQRGKYESNSPATWSDGDWNCDGAFGSGDLVAAFQRGWYEAAPANAVAASLVDSRFGSHQPSSHRPSPRKLTR